MNSDNNISKKDDKEKIFDQIEVGTEQERTIKFRQTVRIMLLDHKDELVKIENRVEDIIKEVREAATKFPCITHAQELGSFRTELRILWGLVMMVITAIVIRYIQLYG